MLRKIMVPLVAFACFAGMSLSGLKQAGAAEGDTAGVKAVIDAYMDAFNKHDPHAVAALFTEDGDFTNGRQVTAHTRKVIDEHLVPVYGSVLKNSHRTYTLRSIRFVTPDVAVAATDYELSGTTNPKGDELPPRKGMLQWVVAKNNGKWLIEVLNESELPAAN
jgi:uncharacterized protein (TIGR02246 family)